MTQSDEDYLDSDSYLGYHRDADRVSPAPLGFASDPYVAGGSGQKLLQKLLPPSLHKYAHLAVAAVNRHVGWLNADQRRDALNVAATTLCKVADNRKPGYSEAQFCAYVKKSISGELLRQYANEIAYRSGRSDESEETEDRRSLRPATVKGNVIAKRDGKLQYRKRRYELSGGLLPAKHHDILRRRLEGETLQTIGVVLGVTAQRVRELELRANTILDEKLARIEKGEKRQLVIREVVTQDPANADLEPYEIDDLVRSWVNPPTKPASPVRSLRRPNAATDSEVNAPYEYDPDDMGAVRTEDDKIRYELELGNEDIEDLNDEPNEEYEEWRYDVASGLEDL